jgi:SAM-dependent methyltransferase
MTFNVAADAYDSFMGRYSRLLAPQMADLAGVRAGQRVLDVGAGPGALTAELVRRVGAELVTAAEPSAPFVEALRERNPGVTVRQAGAEEPPFDDDTFDAALAQLVVHFMTDPVAGLRQMRRVTRPGGVVVASVWDLNEGQSPLERFWSAARTLDPSIADESDLAGSRRGHLEELMTAAGLHDVTAAELWIETRHETFEDWWRPVEAGVGPAGAHFAQQTPLRQAEIRALARASVKEEPFVLRARAWAARGVA